MAVFCDSATNQSTIELKNKKIYLLRHGETEYNLKGMVQGSGIDAPLNATGVKQADAFFNSYKNVPFDKIYVTPLQRTRQTIRRFLDLNIPEETLDGLREISWGDQEGIPFTETSGNEYKRIVKLWSEGDLQLKIQNGESPIEVMERQKPAIRHILSNKDEEHILICTHGRAMRILLCWLLEQPLSNMDNFHHTNCGLYVLNYVNEVFNIDKFNETGHLSGIEMIS